MDTIAKGVARTKVENALLKSRIASVYNTYTMELCSASLSSYSGAYLVQIHSVVLMLGHFCIMPYESYGTHGI